MSRPHTVSHHYLRRRARENAKNLNLAASFAAYPDRAEVIYSVVKMEHGPYRWRVTSEKRAARR